MWLRVYQNCPTNRSVLVKTQYAVPIRPVCLRSHRQNIRFLMQLSIFEPYRNGTSRKATCKVHTIFFLNHSYQSPSIFIVDVDKERHLSKYSRNSSGRYFHLRQQCWPSQCVQRAVPGRYNFFWIEIEYWQKRKWAEKLALGRWP